MRGVYDRLHGVSTRVEPEWTFLTGLPIELDTNEPPLLGSVLRLPPAALDRATGSELETAIEWLFARLRA